jgi:hypothetical protein
LPTRPSRPPRSPPPEDVPPEDVPEEGTVVGVVGGVGTVVGTVVEETENGLVPWLCTVGVTGDGGATVTGEEELGGTWDGVLV